MVDFSLLELREFISISTTNGLSLSEYSFIALRLALQRTCEDFKIKNFLDFVRQFQQRSEVKNALHRRILTQPKELLRDVLNWQFVLKSNACVLSDTGKRVLIIDNNLGLDITSFFLLCKHLNLHLSCTVEWYSFCRSFDLTNSIRFSTKDYEKAQSNLQNLPIKLEEYLGLKSDGYYFTFDYPTSKAEINLGEKLVVPAKSKYDLIVSQNNSLKFNFGGHERFFKSCLFISNENAGLFFGARENLRQCSCFGFLRQPHKNLNYFINEKGCY